MTRMHQQGGSRWQIASCLRRRRGYRFGEGLGWDCTCRHVEQLPIRPGARGVSKLSLLETQAFAVLLSRVTTEACRFVQPHQLEECGPSGTSATDDVSGDDLSAPWRHLRSLFV